MKTPMLILAALCAALSLGSCGASSGTGAVESASAGPGFGGPSSGGEASPEDFVDAAELAAGEALPPEPLAPEPEARPFPPSADSVLLVVIPPEGSSGAGADETRGLESLRAANLETAANIRSIVGTADWAAKTLEAVQDPLVRTLLLCPAPKGTAALFASIRETRKDILLFAVQTAESPLLMQSVADLILDPDFSSRAATLATNAKLMGAKTLVFLKKAKEAGGEQETRLLGAMEASAAAQGMGFASFSLPVAKTKDLRRALSDLLAGIVLGTYGLPATGSSAAFFCADDAFQEALIGECLSRGLVYLEGFRPSPFLGFPEILSLALPSAGSPSDQYPAFLRKVEEEILRKKGAGRVSTWAYGFSYSAIDGLGSLALDAMRKAGVALDLRSLQAALERASPGVPWAIERYKDSVSGVRAKAHFLAYQDSYVFGRGYLGTVKSGAGK